MRFQIDGFTHYSLFCFFLAAVRVYKQCILPNSRWEHLGLVWGNHFSPLHLFKLALVIYNYPWGRMEGQRTLEGCLSLNNWWAMKVYDVYELHVWYDYATSAQKYLNSDYWENRFPVNIGVGLSWGFLFWKCFSKLLRLFRHCWHSYYF